MKRKNTYTSPDYSIQDQWTDYAIKNSVAVKDGDDLPHHLPCFVFRSDVDSFFLLKEFKGHDQDGDMLFWGTNLMNGNTDDSTHGFAGDSGGIFFLMAGDPRKHLDLND